MITLKSKPIDKAQLKPVEFSVDTVLEWETIRNDWFSRLESAATLRIKHLPMLQAHGGRCLVVGAAPSIKQHRSTIKSYRRSGLNMLFSVNAAHDWLLGAGIIPHAHVVFEHDLETVSTALGGQPNEQVVYYVASLCKPKIFRELESYKRVLWHPFYEPKEYIDKITKLFPNEICVAGGYATLFRTLAIGFFLGYRKFDLFGCDSSFKASSHVDGYACANIEPVVNVYGTRPDGEMAKFKTQGGLAYQVKQLLEFSKAHEAVLELRVHGNGLLRYVHESRYPQWYIKGD